MGAIARERRRGLRSIGVWWWCLLVSRQDGSVAVDDSCDRAPVSALAMADVSTSRESWKHGKWRAGGALSSWSARLITVDDDVTAMRDGPSAPLLDGDGAHSATSAWLHRLSAWLGQSGRLSSVRRCILLLVSFCLLSLLYLSYHVSSIQFHMWVSIRTGSLSVLIGFPTYLWLSPHLKRTAFTTSTQE